MERKERIEKYKENLSKIYDNKDIIEGIHNYCDRWCEKCTHTKHCSVFLIEQQNRFENQDINNKEFWENMSIMFQATFEMLAEIIEERGLDIEEIKEQAESPKLKINKTKLEKLATDYGMRVNDWLKNNNDLLTKKAERFLTIDEEKVVSFSDALEVIQWYSFFIGAKVHRTNFKSVLDNDDDFENEDRNGSAKIALIAIERSIEALSLLYKELQEKEDEILEFLIMLSKIKQNLEIKFPDAKKFKRPGFDE